jgi:hypothetical protein
MPDRGAWYEGWLIEPWIAFGINGPAVELRQGVGLNRGLLACRGENDLRRMLQER